MTDDGLTTAERGMAMLTDIHAACATALSLLHTPASGEIHVDKDRIKRSQIEDDTELIVRYTLNDAWGLRMIFDRVTQDLNAAFLVNLRSGDQFPVSDQPVR